MNELKQAFESQDYRKVLELTNGKKELVFIVYRLSALIGLNRYDSALRLLIENRDALFKADPIKTIETNFVLRFQLRQFDEAFDDIGIFGDYPYVSQEVEEELRALPKRVRKAEHDFIKSQNKGEINLSINQSEADLLRNLDVIEIEEIKRYIPELRNIVSSLGKDGARTYALMLLKAGGDKEEIKFLKNGSEFILIPNELEQPFSGDAYLKFINKVNDECKDPSLSNIALSLFSRAYIAAFPEQLIEDNKINDYALAFIDIAKEYLHLDNQTPSIIDPDVILRVHKFLDAAE